MNKPKVSKESTSIKRFTWIGTIMLLCLLLLFFIVTLLGNHHLVSQVALLTEHPFEVNGDIGDVKTNLAQMRVRTERLQAYNKPNDVNIVRLALERLDAEMEALLNEIDSLYLGPKEDTDTLRNAYNEIQEAHELLLQFAVLPNSTIVEISEYEKTNLYPLYDNFEECAQNILSYVRNTQQNIFTSANKMGKTMVIWSIIVIIATTLGLLYFQSSIRKLSYRLYEKNRQFDMLANTVDEAFLIFEQGKKSCDFVSGSAEKVLGLSADKLCEDREALYKYMDGNKAKEIQETAYTGESDIWEDVIEYNYPKSAQRHWLQLRIYRVREKDTVKFIMTLVDRTEERRINQTLQDALVNAQNANNAKRDFLSRMSHEIRTPMNAIIGMTTIAAASIEDRSRIEDCLAKISYSSKHLLMLINDVLDMSRIESNRMRLNQEPFDLFQFLNNFVSVVYTQAHEKGLEFTEKTSGFTENTTYIGDSLRLNQILFNLISNAIKFTPSGGKVSLEVTHLPPRNKQNWIRFVVSDTGIGMDEDGLAKLYIPFEQADATISSKYGGTGLGMSITLNLVLLMGGNINVKSKLGEGTTFTVELPFEKSDVDLCQDQEVPLETLDVLIVDDEKDVCIHTALLLEKMKINAEWVLNGMEAIDKLIKAQEAGHSIDVCFIDWKMPDMDGIETTRRIREEIGNDTPIIIITAYDWTEIEEDARAAGANAFIAKPLFESSLYNVLVNVTKGAFAMRKSNYVEDGNSLNGKRLLLAEDNAINMEIAKSLLEMNGAVVEGVDNGQKALDRFLETEAGYFDAILMDVQMPVMDGCEATRRIRASGKEDSVTIPIIAVTANAFAEDISTVLAAGMNMHISKPIDIKKLCNVLSNL